ncbi:hypothetical protein SUGI_0021780 [Cryptomeria japonica]|nr:hypothetical protein SUGI_0021780 [Cryptomeria japonica]
MGIAMAILAVLMVVFVVIYKIYVLLSPDKTRCMMRTQGILGPNPMFLLGNVVHMKNMIKKAATVKPPVPHNLEPRFVPYFVEWRKQYGKKFLYWLGSEAVLYVQEPELVQEISSSGSLNWGRPAFLKSDRFPLFGNGLIMAEDQDWIHQRRIVSQSLTAEKVKGMLSSVVEASVPVLNEWAKKINEGGQPSVEIDVDGALSKITAQVISKFLFGSSSHRGFEVLDKLKLLQQTLFEANRFAGIPVSRYIPSAGNKKVRRLGEEANSIIIQIIKEHNEYKNTSKGYGDDLLEILLKQVEANLVTTQDVLDQCKTLLIAGQETTKLSLTWTLMLLAMNPEWQEKVRVEVMEITNGDLPDITVFSKMKMMNMVLNESMRLYPPVSYTVRQAKTDIQLRELRIPKGMSVLINIVGMHEDPDIWGENDVYEFMPDRFSNGEANKKTGGFIPFGFGGRICVGRGRGRERMELPQLDPPTARKLHTNIWHDSAVPHNKRVCQSWHDGISNPEF